MKSRRIIAILLALAVIGTGLVFLAHERRDVHHTKARRAWKNEAVAAIRNDLMDSDHLEKRFGKTPTRSDGPSTSEVE